MPAKIKLAVFASGGGSNARMLTRYFCSHLNIRIAAFFTNNPDSGVLAIADEYDINCEVLSNADCKDGKILLGVLNKHNVDFIILAGFLRKIPEEIIHCFKDKIINIHPSLLPKFGGKGMYGMRVHEAVFHSGENMTGCTIHLVNEEYDKGRILAQYFTDVDPEMSPQNIADAVLKLEHNHFSHVIESYILHEFPDTRSE